MTFLEIQKNPSMPSKGGKIKLMPIKVNQHNPRYIL